MVSFKGVGHISIMVSNLKKSKHFYGKLLGLKAISRPNFKFGGAWYSLGGKIELHLIVSRKRTHRWAPLKKLEITYPHFALQVSNPDQTLKQLKATGYRVFEFASSPTKSRQIFVMDPDENMIEFIGPLHSP